MLVPRDLAHLQDWIDSRESNCVGLKDDNQARVVWAVPDEPRRTSTAIIYLHGLTGSQGDGAPQHLRLAKDFGANLFLARLPGHGSDDPKAMAGITHDALRRSADEALAIGSAIGDRVVLVGTSLGASLAIDLAARFPDRVAAVVAWSPGVRPYNEVLLHELCQPGDPIHNDVASWTAPHRQYWSGAVHRDAYRSLAAAFDAYTEQNTFARVSAPFFLGYFYKDEVDQDRAASVPAMLAMYDSLATPDGFKRKAAFSDGAHAVACAFRSAAAERVYIASRDFLCDVVGL